MNKESRQDGINRRDFMRRSGLLMIGFLGAGGVANLLADDARAAGLVAPLNPARTGAVLFIIMYAC